jgi:hypothetical protein
MGKIKSKKVKLEKIKKGEVFQYFVDYDKLKETDRFLQDFVAEFIEKKTCLCVIDSENFYTRKNSDAENKITLLKKELESQELPYSEIITKKEPDNRVFGIKILNSGKVNSYRIGLIVSPDQIGKVTALVKGYNLFYYIPYGMLDRDELTGQFQKVRGDYEELSQIYEYNLYNDSFFHRIRISSKKDISQFLEEVLVRLEC